MAAAGARAETLTDALALGYQNNPTLQEERATLRALDETYVQAMAGFRPQLSASAEVDYLEGPTSSNGVVGAAGPSAADSAMLSLTQPIFTGGQVSSQVRAAMGDILAERQKLRQTEAQVMGSIIQAYADVTRDTAGVVIAQQNVEAFSHMLDGAKAHTEVGDFTRTDLAQAQARQAASRALLATAQAQLAISSDTYLQVVGQNPGELAPLPVLPGLPHSLDEALAVASKNNPGLAQADYAEKAAAARVALAKSAYRPTLSLRASYGVVGTLADSSGGVGAQAVGQYSQQVTAAAVLVQPLFMGGMNASKIRQAAENDTGTVIALEAARRQEIQNVAQAWSQLKANQQNVGIEQDEVSADETAFEGVKNEIELGDRTQFEELSVQQELLQARQALNGARHDSYIASASLLAAMGLLEARYLLPGAKLYSPETSFDHVKHSGAVPWEGVVAGIDALGAPAIEERPPAPAAVLPKPLP